MANETPEIQTHNFRGLAIGGPYDGVMISHQRKELYVSPQSPERAASVLATAPTIGGTTYKYHDLDIRGEVSSPQGCLQLWLPNWMEPRSAVQKLLETYRTRGEIA